ncbi:hypothetical protein BDV93DRAFT_522318 [Ceratobasidium sp. AG-I]|nr:hypothetical protein BDV93DRAFT_522318 [Ceratobasidium sp. AG-I]
MSLATSRQTHRRSGRWSPPLWGCYEYQTSSSEHDSECESCSDSDNDSGSESGERNGAGNERGSETESGSGSGSGSDGADEHERARKLKEKRKGKQPEGGIRRKERIREPVYRPILTIRRSEGFVWNQDLFLPSYIRDRYIATSPPNPSALPVGPTSADSSFSGMDFEIECVDIHVDGNGILSGLIPTAKKEE